ncbi:GNAT family N-acetyltransferase [Ornithinibacillus californiensis]|uniref:GNAT family N-acetyltransferase n=1 Tax=Ornithinibacillus californiensis TaxID=161536 RepID=UPI00064DF785|nr:GNAT family N-acetyltransferase [Ornithinibacillus californiensis]
MNIKIVKYDESYAARVADMWNHSRDGWGGANSVDTEESILHRERNSTNIHTFLALEGEKVVGYCGFSEYREDEGALYIPLLNVRDDYHGRKIGKKLLLTALEEAINLKWPRLDLYTWPGNTKAVPLYKKCGFFWEERDDTTHLMNFMPTVLHTEAVEDFFKDASWYDMSTREIEVKPDGRVENDFHYYEYAWEKENESLRMEFERTGRGIRLIETNDYAISVTVPEHRLVFGDQYEVKYSIINKTGKPLKIDLKGISDKNIEYSLEQSINVTDTTEITGSFYINPIEEEQNSFRTHPCVKTLISINGKQAEFKVGILAKYPAQITAQLPEDLTFIGNENEFHLDMMNNFTEKVIFEMELPASEVMDIKTSKISVEIEAKQRKSIAVPFVVLKHGYYDATLKVKAVKENGETVEFTRMIGIPLRGIGAKFHGENEKKVQLYYGQYFAELDKDDNSIDVGKKKSEERFWIMTPKVGKPYSEELARAKYAHLEYLEDTGFIGAKITYSLTAFPAIKLHLIIKLFSEGLLENYYEIENIQDTETNEPIWLNQSIYLGLERAVIPYRGEIVELKDSIGNSYDNWDERQVTENWIFVNEDSNPHGMCWNSNDKIHFGGWYNYFEHPVGVVGPNSSVQTNPIIFSLGAFHDMDSFRSFARQTSNHKKAKPVNRLSVSLQNNNPIISGETIACEVTDYKSNFLHGELTLSHANQGDEIVKQFNREEEQTQWKTEIPIANTSPISTVKLHAKLDAAIHERETLVIQQGTEPINQEIIQEQGMDTWKVNNGVIEIKATPDFFPAVHSLTYQGQEWLDTSFPTLEPKLWWNPWAGGITSRIADMRPQSLKKEKTLSDFVSLKDNKGNDWKGIRLSTTFEKNEDYKGLTVHQYFLLLPGVPVLCHVSEIDQETGQFFHGKGLQTSSFFKPEALIKDNWVNFQNKAGEWMRVVAGYDENDLRVNRNVVIGTNNREEHLQLIANTENTIREVYINKEVVLTGVSEKLVLPSNKTYFTNPNFYVINNSVIEDTAQHDLQNISFNK